MKKLAIALTLALSGFAAHADVGPIYVSYPGYCNIKELYLNSVGDVYGYERGCSATLNAPMFGTLDVYSNNIYVSSTEPGGLVCLQAYRGDGQLRGGCTNGRQYQYGQPIYYSVSFSLPRMVKDPNGKELPPIPH